MAYLVPSPVRRGYEFAPGIGIIEVAVAGVGIVIGGALMGLTILLHLGYISHAVALIIPGGIGVGAVMLKINDMPLYVHGQFAWRWMHSVKRRLYDFRYPTDY